MDKILTVIQREYLSRVKTKMFLISTLLAPIGLGILVIVPLFSAMMVEEEFYTVYVTDKTGVIFPFLDNNDPDLQFKKSNLTREDQLEVLGENEVLLNIPSTAATKEGIPVFLIDAKEKLSLQVDAGIKTKGNQAFRAYSMSTLNITGDQVDKINRKPSWENKINGEKKNAMIGVYTGYVISMLIYIMLATYGTVVMRGVIEEKTNRIVEVIISSIRPFQLMLGKIIAIGAVGLTQFLLWGILFMGILFGVLAVVKFQPELMNGVNEANAAAADMDPADIQKYVTTVTEMIEVISDNFLLILFYFLGGYMMYGSLFAAVGSAVDQESDAQSLVWPVMMPLLLPMLFFANLMQNPNGSLAIFFSHFPLFSPITMMLRKTSGDVAWWELGISMTLLVLGFLGCVWLAAKIYRVGILMYGKKTSLKEIGKWVFHY